MGELIGLMHSMQDYRDCNAYFITETWLNSSIPDTAVVKPPGFALFCENVQKGNGGGLVFSLTRPGA